jgi:hypothetical protein
MKDFGTAAREAIAAGAAMSVGAVYIAVPGEPFAVWGGYGEIEIEGVTYVGIGDRGLVSTSTAAVGSGDQGITLELSGIEPQVLELADTRAANRAEVMVRRLIFDASGRNLLAAPVFARGRLDRIKTKDTIGGTSIITAMVEGAVRGLGRAGGRMRSNADQRMCDADDDGMANVAHAGETSIYWGGKPAQTSQQAFSGTKVVADALYKIFGSK